MDSVNNNSLSSKATPKVGAIPTITLNSGDKMPTLGLGTWLSDTGAVETAVVAALKMGYTLIDCAWVYANEKEVGSGIQKCISDGTVKRSDLWITSKLWSTSQAPKDVEPACRESLANLGLDYLDLYLIHWPITLGPNYTLAEQLPLSETWKAMIDLKKKGLVRNIGVSNFNESHIMEIFKATQVWPAVNQIEQHPLLVRQKFHDWLASKNIAVTGYSPLANPSWQKQGYSTYTHIKPLFGNPVVSSIAKKHSCTDAQVLIAFGMALGASVIPKSTNPKRIQENFNSLKVHLSGEQVESLKKLDANFHVVNPTWGPFQGEKVLGATADDE